MYLTKTRVIIGDLFVLVVLGLMYSATKGFKENVLALSLVLLVLVARSIYYHVNWYKTTKRIY
ncbi:MAG: hypothetical protein JST19_20235 [Bacteroidetes bacterium]|nr:hypothetical protein [Bacteroidota bacterium]